MFHYQSCWLKEGLWKAAAFQVTAEGNPRIFLELLRTLAGALELFRTSRKNLERPLFPPLTGRRSIYL